MRLPARLHTRNLVVKTFMETANKSDLRAHSRLPPLIPRSALFRRGVLSAVCLRLEFNEGAFHACFIK